MSKKKKVKVRRSYQKRAPYQRRLKVFITIVVILWLAFVGIYHLGKMVTQSSTSATTATTEEYLSHDDFLASLVPKAQELHAQYGVLPSIILGQAILESDWGRSRLASEYHNLFGIKAGAGQEKVHLETQEYVDGQWLTVTADFRVFGSNAESLEAHSALFVNGTTWNPQQYQSVLLAKDYQSAAQALQTSGYATDPTYAEKIIGVIEEYNLTQYDSFTATQ